MKDQRVSKCFSDLKNCFSASTNPFLIAKLNICFISTFFSVTFVLNELEIHKKREESSDQAQSLIQIKYP